MTGGLAGGIDAVQEPGNVPGKRPHGIQMVTPRTLTGEPPSRVKNVENFPGLSSDSIPRATKRSTVRAASFSSEIEAPVASGLWLDSIGHRPGMVPRSPPNQRPILGPHPDARLSESECVTQEDRKGTDPGMPLIEPFMSRQVLTAPADQTLEQAAQSMTERRVGAVVITRGPSVVGILTEREVLRSVARGLVPWSTSLDVCMTHDPVSIAPGTEALVASRLMFEGGFRHLPVLEEGRLVGILSLRDLWRATEAERILQAKEEERRRLAAEIHDGVSQELISIGYRLKACERLVGRDELGALQELAAANELVDHALKDVRVAINALRPSPVDELGMIPAIQALARRTFGPEVEVVLAASLDARVTSEMEGALYRIIQEVLNNVRRHAGARRVTVRIEPGDDRLSIRLTDDGKGFDLEMYRRSRPESSFGLMGIAERVERLGGRLHIQSEVGTGTSVEVVVPLPGTPTGRNDPS